MLSPVPPTGFAAYSRRAARALLVATAVTILFLVAVSQSSLRNRHLERVADGGGADIRLYQAEIERLRSGEGYYRVAGQELRARGYPTRSVFNWRVPLLFQALSMFPSALLIRAVLASLGIAVIAMAFRLLEREAGTAAALGGALLLAGALLPNFLGDVYVLPEVWAATLIALSLCAYGGDYRRVAATAGIASLFVRELAGLYCLVCLLLACRAGAWREAAAWIGGMGAYALYFAWHASTVFALIGTDDLAHRQDWIQLAGAPFVIAACQMNCLLLLLPQWVTAIYLPLAMLGFVGWRSRFAERAGLVAAAYLVAFALVGQPFNQYWGVLIAPVLVLGAARSPAAIRDLWRAAQWGQSAVGSTCAG